MNLIVVIVLVAFIAAVMWLKRWLVSTFDMSTWLALPLALGIAAFVWWLLAWLANLPERRVKGRDASDSDPA